MDKIILTFWLVIIITQTLSAQVSKTVNVTNAGSLSYILSSDVTTVTDLTITGNIDTRDFKTMRDDMPNLSVLDISKATIVDYFGTGGTSNNTTVFLRNAIPESAFDEKQTLRTILMPPSTVSIGTSAFESCNGLASITIPNSVTKIGIRAFRGCNRLASINIPNSVTSIEPLAFDQCYALTSVTIGNSVTTIGESAFSRCKKLTSVNIPSLVKSIGRNAFYECIKLTSIIIPNSVTSIGQFAFCMCTSLTSITIPDSIKSIEDGTFQDCSGLVSVVLPDLVEYINSFTFNGCTSLTSITIPNSVKTIGHQAFQQCTGLKDVYVSWQTPINTYSMYGPVFYGITYSNVFLHVPAAGTESEYKAAYERQNFNITTATSITQSSIAQSIVVYSTDGKFCISTPRSISVAVYTFTGVKVFEKQLEVGVNVLNGMPSGAFLVTFPDRSAVKVVF